VSLADALIEAAFQALLQAQTPLDRRVAGSQFTLLIRARNAERNAKEIARIERQKGLR
jgi:hypothetical protein